MQQIVEHSPFMNDERLAYVGTKDTELYVIDTKDWKIVKRYGVQPSQKTHLGPMPDNYVALSQKVFEKYFQ